MLRHLQQYSAVLLVCWSGLPGQSSQFYFKDELQKIQSKMDDSKMEDALGKMDRKMDDVLTKVNSITEFITNEGKTIDF